MLELHSRYLQGVSDLLQMLGAEDEDYLTVLALQGRLAQAISEIQQYGPTDSARAEIARVTMELDRLCLARLKQSFYSFCGMDILRRAGQPKIYHNLPSPDYEEFVGREQELAGIYRLLAPTSRHFLITIDGIGGIGKSALALEVAHNCLQRADDLPIANRFEAIIWTSAKQNVLTAEGIAKRAQSLRTLEDIYTTISITLEREDITRARPEEQSELVRRALARQRTLLFVDNLETIDDEAVLSFLRELPVPTKAIVTTRHRIDIAYPVRLEEMPWKDALKLIRQECQRKGVALTSEQTRKLYQRTGGVPLALVWSIAQIGTGYGVNAVLARLANPKVDIAQFCFEGTVQPIRGTDTYKLLMALALFATDANRETLGWVAGLGKDVMSRDEGLVQLERLSLVNKIGDRFSFSPLTREYALAELKAHPSFEQQAGRRWLDDLKTRYEIVDTEYYWRWHSFAFMQEGQNVLKAIDWAHQHGSADDVFELMMIAYDYLEVAGRWSEAIAYVERALSLARSVENSVAIARLANILGWTLRQQGNYQQAIPLFKEALKRYRETSNRVGESIGLRHLSGVFRKLGQFERAHKFCDQAWAIAEEIEFGDLKALVKTEYGKLARDMEDWDLAWNYFIEVRNWFQERGEETPRDETLARGTWGQLALVAYHLGRPEEARELCLRSLDFFETSGTKGYLATLNYRLALAEEALGEDESALRHAKIAVDWFERLGMKPDLEETAILLERLTSSNKSSRGHND